MMATALALAVIASIALIGAGINGLAKGGVRRRQAWLMIGAGLVTLINAGLLATMPAIY